MPSFLSILVVIIPVLSRLNAGLSSNQSVFCSRDRYYFQTDLDLIPGKDNSTSLSHFFLNICFLYCHIYCFVNSFATKYSEDLTYNWTISQPPHLHRHKVQWKETQKPYHIQLLPVREGLLLFHFYKGKLILSSCQRIK